MYSRETAGQFVKYAVVGLCSSLITYGSFLTLFWYTGLHHLTASGIGYCAGLVTSFLINKEWTFRVRGAVEGMLIRFALMHGMSMTLNVGALQFVTASLGIVPEFGQIAALGCTGVLNFLGSKCWAFRSVNAASPA